MRTFRGWLCPLSSPPPLPPIVIPAQAGTHLSSRRTRWVRKKVQQRAKTSRAFIAIDAWVPACAGMTREGSTIFPYPDSEELSGAGPRGAKAEGRQRERKRISANPIPPPHNPLRIPKSDCWVGVWRLLPLPLPPPPLPLLPHLPLRGLQAARCVRSAAVALPAPSCR